MRRLFTLSEAEKLLPEVERAMKEALALHEAHEQAESRLHEAMRRIMMLGGSLVNRDEIAGMRTKRDEAAYQLKTAVDAIHEYGCQVKDLKMGLVDFPTLYRGEEVLLCWKFGEEGIRFWHGLTEGFRGRKPVDDDFRANHKGGHVH
jgi:hypothetical protein